MTLALLSIAAAPTDRIVYRKILQNQARQVADAWFRCLLEQRPRMASKFVVPVVFADESSASGGGARKQANPNPFVKTPVVLISGDGTARQVRFYEPVSQSREGKTEMVELMYAVTFDDAGQRKSFFVNVTLCRKTFTSGETDWRVYQTVSGVQPKGWAN